MKVFDRVDALSEWTYVKKTLGQLNGEKTEKLKQRVSLTHIAKQFISFNYLFIKLEFN